MNWTGPRAIAVVSITGKGTWDDPRRPALPKEGILSYRWLPSDDGHWAIVEIGEGAGGAEALNALEKISADAARNNTRLFRQGVHTRAEVELEIKRFRKTFSLDDLSQAAVVKGAK